MNGEQIGGHKKRESKAHVDLRSGEPREHNGADKKTDDRNENQEKDGMAGGEEMPATELPDVRTTPHIKQAVTCIDNPNASKEGSHLGPTQS